MSKTDVVTLNPLSPNPKKWSNTIKQLFGNCRQIA